MLEYEFVNLTPHTINLNDGRSFEPSGTIARVSSKFTDFEGVFTTIEFGQVTDIPEPKNFVMYIVSGMVKSASKRTDICSPATGHPDTIRNDKGHIVSVPGFIV